MPDFQTDLAANRVRIRAVPMFWDGPIPPERDRRVEDDDKSFSEVLLLFLRSWPYIRPQFLGRWLIPGQGVEPHVAETVSGGGYQFTYAPFLVAAIALAGPLLGAVPATMAWPMSLLYPPIAALVLSMFALAFTTGRRQMIATIALVLSGLGTNISATFFIDGYADSFYAAAVTIAAIVGWICQFRIDHPTSCSGSTRTCGSRSWNAGTSCRSATTANTARATPSSASTRTAPRSRP